MRKCGKGRCKICSLAEEGNEFDDGKGSRKYYVNYDFDCDSKGVVYLLKFQRYLKQYIGSTITAFRMRFNNHKSSLLRYGKGLFT